MKKKILVVSPTPTHPAIAGNRKRIFTMLKTLQAMGGEVTLVLDDQEGSGGHTSSPTDYQGMRAEWDAFYRVQDFGFPAAGEAPVTLRIFRAAGSFLRGHLHFLYELAAPLWLSLRMRIHREIDSGG
ncbi:MAG TPA: hypothetical protein PK773_07925, partial [Aminivibrio sp.]|nr:hypothetical protein [Aminivibrio sp.]